MPSISPSQAKTEDALFNENTLRTQLDQLKISKHKNKSPNDSMKSYKNLEKKILEILMKSKAVNLKYIIKFLIGINTSKKVIRTCLIQRSKIIENDKLNILKNILSIKCKSENCLEFVLGCYKIPLCNASVKNILKIIDVVRLKNFCYSLISKNILEGILGLGFCCRFNIDEEILEKLVNYIDNINPFMSFFGIQALNNILKKTANIALENYWNIINPLSNIIPDKIKTIKNFVEIRIQYSKYSLKILYLLGDIKKSVEIAENIIQTGDQKIISSVYKFFVKMKLSSRYFEKLKKYFWAKIYGSKGKYILKIAEISISWFTEQSAIAIITDTSDAFSSKQAADLLLKWDAISVLDNFLRIENSKYLLKARKILEFFDKDEYKYLYEKYEFIATEIEANINELANQYGISIIEILNYNRKPLLNIKDWIYNHLLKADTIEEFEDISKLWQKIVNKPIYNSKISQKLIGIIQIVPVRVLKVSLDLKLKSDAILRILIPLFLNKSIDLSLFESTILTLIQLKNPSVLNSLHKIIYFADSDPEFCYSVHKKIRKIIKNLFITNDTEFEVFLESVCKYNCSIFLEQIWKYLLNKAATNQRYFITDYAETILRSNSSWDAKFSLKFSKLLGLLRVKKTSEEITEGILTSKMLY